jgi:hypothetical protein
MQKIVFLRQLAIVKLIKSLKCKEKACFKIQAND